MVVLMDMFQRVGSLECVLKQCVSEAGVTFNTGFKGLSSSAWI